jgi:hypothetical protein
VLLDAIYRDKEVVVVFVCIFIEHIEKALVLYLEDKDYRRYTTRVLVNARVKMNRIKETKKKY